MPTGNVTRAVLLLGALLCAAAGEAPAEGPHPVAVEVVKPGREGLELTARLSADGEVMTRNIAWTIRHVDGGTAYAGEAGSVDISLAPGDYIVDVEYGAAGLSRAVSLPPGARLLVGFVLDAGGLSINSDMTAGDFPPLDPRVRIFALPSGRMVALKYELDDVMRLPAGRYRVEALAHAGNAAAVTDVEVKAGRVSTVSFTHKAGLARLAFVGAPTAEVTWDVEDAKGRPVAREAGLSADLVLLPGTYTARAAVGGELLSARFHIAAGETRDIMLGN